MKNAIKLLMAVLLVTVLAGCIQKDYKVSIEIAKNEYETGEPVAINISVSGTKATDKIRICVHEKNTTATVFETTVEAEHNVVLNDLEENEYIAEILINDETAATTSFTVIQKQLEELVITVTDEGDYKLVSFNVLPTDVKQLQDSLDLTDEYQVAATLITVLAHYEINPEQALLMLDYIDGPNEIGNVDKSQMKEQFAQYPYVARSYFENTSVDNNYTCDSYTVRVFENPYSRTEDGYVTLRVKSSGADIDRGIGLKQKKSTGEWFADNYLGILAGIRVPAEADPWY